jgi:hypothetical protein
VWSVLGVVEHGWIDHTQQQSSNQRINGWDGFNDSLNTFNNANIKRE